jgi:peptidase M50-like protein
VAPQQFFTHLGIAELLVVALWPVLAFVSIAIHELTHAYFVLRTAPNPGRVIIAIGCAGPRIATWRRERFEVQISLYPRRGFVRWNSTGMSVRDYRRMVRAGPWANVIFGLLLGAAAMTWSRELGLLGWLLLIYGATTNVWMGRSNLQSRIVIDDEETHYSDGFRLAQLAARDHQVATPGPPLPDPASASKPPPS